MTTVTAGEVVTIDISSDEEVGDVGAVRREASTNTEVDAGGGAEMEIELGVDAPARVAISEDTPPDGAVTDDAFPWPQYHVLSFDPGTRDLGVALVSYGAEGSDPLDDLQYYIRYGAIWDIINDSAGTLQNNLEALHGVLTSQPILNQVIEGDPAHLDIIIENQEGCDFSNAALTASLMRMCGIASALWFFFAARGHHVTIVGKKSKWGWASYINSPNYKVHNEAKKREIRKKYVTYYVIDLMTRQRERILQLVPDAVKQRGAGDSKYDRLLNVCIVTQQMGNNFNALNFEEKAHICDSAVAAMFHGRKRFRKSSKNVIAPAVWERLVETVQSGGRRGYSRQAQDASFSASAGRSHSKRARTGGAPHPAAKKKQRVAISRYITAKANDIPAGMSLPPM